MPKLPHYPIIVEDYPITYTGPEFLTLLEYGNERYVTIIDVVTSTSISAYVLDTCKSESIDDVMVVSLVATNWEAYKSKPISILFGMLGISQNMSRIYRTFQLSDINRVIGRFPTVNLGPSRTVKRRRRREIDKSIEIKIAPYISKSTDE